MMRENKIVMNSITTNLEILDDVGGGDWMKGKNKKCKKKEKINK